MNATLIEKIIKMCYKNPPAIDQENPLLNKDVAKLLASSYVKLLNNPEITSELRELLLQSIRTACQSSRSGHVRLEETDILKHCYEGVRKEQNTDTVDCDKILDTFLIRNMKEMYINSIYPPSVKPDIIQALGNLKAIVHIKEDFFLNDIINWDINNNNEQYAYVLKPLWNADTLATLKSKQDDISIKLKPQIEMILLRSFQEICNVFVIDLKSWMIEENDLGGLIRKCAVSPECFQICCSIMNSMFIMKNFNNKLQQFIKCFILNVKFNLSCLVEHIFDLYPNYLRHIVALLDMDRSLLPEDTRKMYIQVALESLHSLHDKCKSDVIMLLSHFDCGWFDDYYNYYYP